MSPGGLFNCVATMDGLVLRSSSCVLTSHNERDDNILSIVFAVVITFVQNRLVFWESLQLRV